MSIEVYPGMTRADVERKIDKAARKRDHSCDVLGKPLLGMTYQQEIDDWNEVLKKMPADQLSTQR